MKTDLIDIHTHSVLSGHAYSSLTENIEYAVKNGLKYYGISEHQPDDVGVGAHKFAFANCKRITPHKMGNTNILFGIELNILDNEIDYKGVKIEKLDFAIASMHDYVYSSKHTVDENTKNYLMAINNPYVKIIGHMDNPKFPCDYKTVILEAKRNGVLIELNNTSLQPNGSRAGAKEIDKEILELCKKYNVEILLGSDAHIKYDVGNHNNCIGLLEEINFPDELVVNYNEDLIHKYFYK